MESQENDPSQHQNRQLHICPDCDSKLVQPERWEKTPSIDSWKVWLRCPECEHREIGVFSVDEIDKFDEALEDGGDLIMDTLDSIDRENMENLTGVFTTALQADLIGADDFRPRNY